MFLKSYQLSGGELSLAPFTAWANRAAGSTSVLCGFISVWFLLANGSGLLLACPFHDVVLPSTCSFRRTCFSATFCVGYDDYTRVEIAGSESR